MQTEWQWCRLHEISSLELYALVRARINVFVVEQHCPYEELDGLDLDAHHLIGRRDGELIAYLRLLAPGTRYSEASLGRILTTRTARGSGVGRELVARGMSQAALLYPGRGVRISAQVRLQHFYGSFGFVAESEPYDEDGIPHIEMAHFSTG